MGEHRGSIGFLSPCRPPVALDIYPCPLPQTQEQSHDLRETDECRMTDGRSCNYNGQAIPPAALKAMLGRPKLASVGTHADVDSGLLSGIVFISERRDGLETLHIALRLPDRVEVFNFAEVYGTFDGVRMEDSGCFAGDYLVYVTTKDPASESRQPWTAVYKTHLETGKTDRLTPPSEADLSPSVSPSGQRIAVASFEKKGGWRGERENLKTDIFVMNIEEPYERALVIEDGGWPTWGSGSVMYFHRKSEGEWGIFRTCIEGGTRTVHRVTPRGINAVTPVAIGLKFVAAAVAREEIQLTEFRDTYDKEHYRHIEIFSDSGDTVFKVTDKINPKANHYNPFVVVDKDGNNRIGYNCCKDNLFMGGEKASKGVVDIKSSEDGVGLFRVSGMLPVFSADGTKLAFLDNNSSEVWVADSEGLRLVYQVRYEKAYCPEWNPKEDTLYVCFGESLGSPNPMHIHAIHNVFQGRAVTRKLTRRSNNAFPSADPTGSKLVFRSSRDPRGIEMGYKNLYIMEDAETGEYGDGIITQLTHGDCIDTHCKWSPRGDWIVFSSNRGNATQEDEERNSVHFAVYLVRPDDHTVLIRVSASESDFAGHINHPFFSPDGKSIVVTADRAAVSVDPMSLPVYVRSARPYADIFIVDIDLDDVSRSPVKRMTHSRFGNAAGTWSWFTTKGAVAEAINVRHGC